MERLVLLQNTGGTGVDLTFADSSWSAHIVHNSGDLTFQTGGSSNSLTIKSSGYVGIGTTSPSALLHLSSTTTQDLFRVDDNGAGDTSPFVIDKDGKVGIGTVSPAVKLHVEAGAGNNAVIRIAEDSSSYTTLTQIADGEFQISRVTTGGVDFGIQSDGDMYLGMNGNVGIGTTEPYGKLHLADIGSVDVIIAADIDDITETDVPRCGRSCWNSIY